MGLMTVQAMKECTSVLVRLVTLLQFHFDRSERLLQTDDNCGRLEWIGDTLLLFFLEVFFENPQLLKETTV